VRLSTLILVSVMCCASLASAQSTGAVQWYSTQRGTGVISGHVIAADGRPLARADVSLQMPGGRRTVVADEQGWFEFRELAPAAYNVSATAAGYLASSYGQTLIAARPAQIPLKSGQTRSNIDVILHKSGVLTVQITDQFNAPVEGAWVQVTHSSQVFWENGKAQSVSRSTKQRTATTNDRGEIRVADLKPGDYYISASLPGTSRKIFYPGVARIADAGLVTVELSQEMTIGFSMVRSPAAEPPPRRGVITIHVTDESGNPREGVEVRALAVSGDGETRTMTRPDVTPTDWPNSSDRHKEFYTDDNGDARIYGLPDGQYLVVAQPLLSHIVDAGRRERELVFPAIYYPGTPQAANAQPISLALWDEVNLDLQIAPVRAGRITGRVVRPDGEPSRSTIVLRWNPDGPLYSETLSTADVRVELVDGTFVFPVVHPGDYILETDDGDLSKPEGHASLSIRLNEGEDINDLLLAIVPRHRAP
jgi:protocatechuate 3,4-dioxygenase beta subunit